MQKQPSIKFLLRDSYLAVIKNSVGTRMYRNFYALVDGVKTDVGRDGQLSCAYFVSSVLAALALIKKSHATVGSTIKDLQESGWHEIPGESEPPVGSVIVWKKVDFGGGEMHGHIGFYIGHDTAISNSEKTGCPIEHPWRSAKHDIEYIFWNPTLDTADLSSGAALATTVASVARAANTQ